MNVSLGLRFPKARHRKINKASISAVNKKHTKGILRPGNVMFQNEKLTQTQLRNISTGFCIHFLISLLVSLLHTLPSHTVSCQIITISQRRQHDGSGGLCYLPHKTSDLSSILRSHKVEEPVPTSCPLTSTYTQHIYLYTQHKKH